MSENIIPDEYVPCGLCGAEEARVLYTGSSGERTWDIDDIVASSDRYGIFGTIVKCRRCGLVYADPRVSTKTLEQGYLDSEDKDYLVQTESRSINAFMSLAVIRRHVPEGRLLEIGCSTGFFLNAARIWFEPRGLELSRWAADFVRQKLSLDVDSKNIEDAGIPGDHFDVVVMNDVIEHLPSPKKTLAEIFRVLKPGGIVYIVTPEYGSVLSRLQGRFWWALRPGHVYYFSRVTLSRMLKELGYEIVHMESYGRIFSWGYWLSRLTTYPEFVQAPISWFIRTLRLENKFLYINSRDSMEVIAKRPKTTPPSS